MQDAGILALLLTLDFAKHVQRWSGSTCRIGQYLVKMHFQDLVVLCLQYMWFLFSSDPYPLEFLES